MSNLTALVQKLWNYSNILRYDGLPDGAVERGGGVGFGGVSQPATGGAFTGELI